MASTFGSAAAICNEIRPPAGTSRTDDAAACRDGRWRKTGLRHVFAIRVESAAGKADPGDARRSGNFISEDQSRQIKWTVDAINFTVAVAFVAVGRANLFLIDDQFDQGLVGAGGDLQPHRVSAAAGPQSLFDQPQHVVRFLFDHVDVAVAGNPKSRRRFHGRSRRTVPASRAATTSSSNTKRNSPSSGLPTGPTAARLRHLYNREQLFGAQSATSPQARQPGRVPGCDTAGEDGWDRSPWA